MTGLDAPIPVGAAAAPRFSRLAAYLSDHVPGLGRAPTFAQFPGGFSNHTYLVHAGQTQLVVKAAPPGIKAKGAHDVGREHRLLAALDGVYRYAPRPVLYCEDAGVFGEPFCVMERLNGVVIRAYPDAGDPDAETHFATLLNAMAELHAIDCAAPGLRELGRPEGYRERQIAGWQGRLEAARTPDMADFGAITRWLAAHAPTGAHGASVVHNDFKLDNLVWHTMERTRLVGVLDWEMATLGDPLMDLAYTLSFWKEAGDPKEFRAMRGMPSTGVFKRGEAIARYGARTGRNLEQADFFLCLGFLRRAAIEQQKYARFVRKESADPRYADLHEEVRVLRDMCLGVIEGRVSA